MANDYNFEDYYLDDVCSKRIFFSVDVITYKKVTLNYKKMVENAKYNVIVYICRDNEFGWESANNFFHELISFILRNIVIDLESFRKVKVYTFLTSE